MSTDRNRAREDSPVPDADTNRRDAAAIVRLLKRLMLPPEPATEPRRAPAAPPSHVGTASGSVRPDLTP